MFLKFFVSPEKLNSFLRNRFRLLMANWFVKIVGFLPKSFFFVKVSNLKLLPSRFFELEKYNDLLFDNSGYNWHQNICFLGFGKNSISKELVQSLKFCNLAPILRNSIV